MSKKGYIISISIIGIFFFIFGFVTWINSTLIPYLEIACQINKVQSTLVTFAFYIAYTIMALPSSWVLKKTGFKNGMSLGLFIMAIGSLTFLPAASTRIYGIFLIGLFIMGTGLALLQTASNPYITILGPRETAARRISIMGICNKLAGIIASILLAYIVLNDADRFSENLKLLNEADKVLQLRELASRVLWPYAIISAVFIVLGFLIRFAPLPNVELEDEPDSEQLPGPELKKSNILQYPHLILGAVTLFFYVGIEVIVVDYCGKYGQAINIPLASSKFFPSLSLFAMILGYILGILLIPKIVSQRKLLVSSALSGIIFSLVAIIIPSTLSTTIRIIDPITFSLKSITLPYTVLFIALLGLSNAIVWPAIWPLAIHGLGKFIKTGSALLIMAIAGGALLPLLWGYLSDAWGAQNAYWIAVPCYLIILYFATYGYKVRKWR